MANKEFIQECLQYHNTLRSLHNSPDLVIDLKLNRFAQDWADLIAAKDTLKHRKEDDYGENLYVCYGDDSGECDLEPRMPVQAWYDEISEYEFGEPSPADICPVGHFTQLVWCCSKKLGVGVATSATGKVYVVCLYDPPGNIRDEFANNVFPKDEDAAALLAAGAIDGEADWAAGEGESTLDLNAEGRLKAIPEEEMRVWLAWLTNVADVAVGEWQDWLKAYVELAARMNDRLLEAKREIEEERKRLAAKPSETDAIEAVHDLEGKSDAAAATDDVDKEAVDDKGGEEAAEKAEFRSEASAGNVPTSCDYLKRIPIPRCAEEVHRLSRQFRRRAKKYRELYAYWLAQSDRVMEEIGAKPAEEQVYPREENPSFFYLREQADADARSHKDDDEDGDDDDDYCDDRLEPGGSLERISYRGELHLFFNLKDELGDVEEPIPDGSSTRQLSIKD